MMTYWYHPESESVLAIDEVDRDVSQTAVLCDEISKEQYDYFQQNGKLP